MIINDENDKNFAENFPSSSWNWINTVKEKKPSERASELLLSSL